MRVDVVACINEAHSEDLNKKTVIVVDVLRATSSIIVALEQGCVGIVPVETIQQARNARNDGDLLSGERFCKKITGFDYGNSPSELLSAPIQGKRIIMTTTNGIRAIQKSQKALHLLVGAIINAEACAKVAKELQRDIVIVCAGTDDHFSFEDGLGAGMIIEELLALHQHEEEVSICDLGLAMLSVYRWHKDSIQESFSRCMNGKKLSKLGFHDDLVLCSQANAFTVVPIMKDQLLIPYDVLKKQPVQYNK